MARHNGRSVTVDWDSVTIVGVRSKSFDITADYVDVTTDDDDGWATYLSNPGKRGMSFTVGGVTEDQILIAELTKAQITGEQFEINLPTGTGAGLSGTGLIQSFSGSGEHDGEYTFEMSGVCNGAPTYTAGT
jgi:TP901-1 family phage major tail protein